MLHSIKISKYFQEEFKLLCRTEYYLSVLWTLCEPIFLLSFMWCETKTTVPLWSINLNCTCWSLYISKWQWQWLQPGDFFSESGFKILTELHRISMSLEIRYMEPWTGFLSRMTDKKTSLPVPWGAVTAGDPRGISVKAQAKQASYIQGSAKALHQGWRQSNAAAMIWPSLPVPLKKTFATDFWSEPYGGLTVQSSSGTSEEKVKREQWNRTTHFWPKRRCTLTYPEGAQLFKDNRKKKSSGCNRDTRLWKGHFQQQLRKAHFRIVKSFAFSTCRANATSNRNVFDEGATLSFSIVWGSFWFF